MAGVSAAAQFRAVAQMRWRILLNTLRTRRGGFELGARVLTQGFFAFVGLGIGLGLGFGAYQIAAHSSLRLLAALFWPLLLFWQLVPITVASFQENADLSIFLRFPVTFSSYALLYILFGLFDIGSLVGGIGLLGIFIGASAAQPRLTAWIAISLVLFAIFNVLLTRMIFAWIERWLAQRRTREILGLVFLFLMLGAQLLNPALYQHSRYSHLENSSSIMHEFRAVGHAQRFLPPGLAANAIAGAHRGTPLASAADLLLLIAFGAAAGAGLSARLHAEYRGENLGEAPARAAPITRVPARRSRLEGSGPIAAVMEKEIRYIMRSGVMLYGLLAPLIIVFLFSGAHGAHGPGFGGQFALPIGVAYGFLGLTRFIYNNLGGEGAGIQIYFLSPAPFRKVLLAKNIVHLGIFLVELILVCSIVVLRSGLPSPQMLAVTVCWLLFAIPTQLAVGNILSITMAYRMNMTRMSREQGAAGNALLAILTQFLVFGVGIAVYLPLDATGHAVLAAPVLLVLAAGSFFLWWRVLANSSEMLLARRELLIANLYRTT